MLEDLDLIAKPDPTMIKDFFEITNRDRAPWDAETLLMMLIARQSMAQRATDKDCEQPYVDSLQYSLDELQEKNESVVGSFFSKWKGKK